MDPQVTQVAAKNKLKKETRKSPITTPKNAIVVNILQILARRNVASADDSF